MQTFIIDAQIILPQHILNGYVVVEHGKISGVEKGTPDAVPKGAKVLNLGGKYLSPGFIDLHTHGAGGADYLDGTTEAFETAGAMHLSHGTTALLPTTVAASREEILRCIDAFKASIQTNSKGPALLGLHMEGPYLNPKQKGAINPRYIRNPDPNEYQSLVEYADGAILRWTMAPELSGATEFAEYLLQNGILPSIGHSEAEYSHVLKAYESGCTHVTHLYSAMSTIVRRGGFRFPGVTESAYILDGMTVEIIADGCHLPPEMLRMVWSLKGSDKTCIVCDSMRCAGLEVKEALIGSQENGQRVIIEDGVAKLPDRSAFAGSVATDDRLVRTMWKKADVSLTESVKMMTLTPAKIIGEDSRRGSIAPGKYADLICFDDEVCVKGVMLKGEGVLGILQ